MERKRIPLLIDTDPGVDDFFCLCIGCAFSEIFDLKAVTTIGGNNSTDTTTKNALDILRLLNRDDVPVGRGSDSFLTHPFGESVTKFHGENGLGNLTIPASEKAPHKLCACDLIYETARSCDGKLVIVTVGPETNLALAFKKYPDLKDMISKIVVMGGSLTTGNCSPYAEANIFHDAEAADVVFSSGIHIDMIGLNITRKANLPREIFDPISLDARKDLRQVMQGLIDFRNGEPMHDAVAIATLIDDSFITWIDANASIEIDDKERYGQTLINTKGPSFNARVAFDIDVSGYYAIMERMLKYYQ